MKIKNLSLVLFLLVVGLLAQTGCVSNKKIVYLQAKGEEKGKTTFVNPYQLQAKIIRTNDVVYVLLSSLYEETNDVLKLLYQNQAGTGLSFSDEQLYMNGYAVDDEGYIDLPLFGRYFVKGKRVEELEAELQDSISQQFKGAYVRVRIPGTKVTVLGDVKLPGKFVFFQEQVSIFEALAEAGDMEETARRKRVKLLRTSGDTITVHTLDLTKRDFLASKFYYLRPDDIIYVEPMTVARFIGSRTSAVTTVLTFLSPILLIYNIFNKN